MHTSPPPTGAPEPNKPASGLHPQLAQFAQAQPVPSPHELVLKVIPLPADCNINGDIFGGWVMAQVDLAGSVLPYRIVSAAARQNAAANSAQSARIATVAVNEFIFKQPVRMGDLLSFYAEVLRVGSSSITVRVEVFAERRDTPSCVVKVTEATLTYVAIDEQGKPKAVFAAA